MALSTGTEVYDADVSPVLARGVLFSEPELATALTDRLPSILWDDAGRIELSTLLAGIASTDFEVSRLAEILNVDSGPQEWRVGEALAEAYLVDHRQCQFPWPSGRDLKNPGSSPTGTDLVGFNIDSDRVRFAFGEVKTSQERRWPPSVVTGRHGLQHQLEVLRDSHQHKENLVKYLGYHAKATTWLEAYKGATIRYLADPSDIILFGFLVRDVEPRDADLSSRAMLIARECPLRTGIELRALYLPEDAIGTLASRARETKSSR